MLHHVELSLHEYIDNEGPDNIGTHCFFIFFLPPFFFCSYTRLSLARLCLSRITAYLEVKIWSLFSHEHITIGTKILWKRGESSFPQYFQYISNFRSQITYSVVMWLFDLFFPNSANLIYQGSDI